jgi:hypothetical protein
MPRLRNLTFACAAAATSTWLGTARADCAGPISPCIDANAAHWAPGSSFVGLDSAPLRQPGAYTLLLGGEWLQRPWTLHVDSPDPDGREVRVVNERLDVTLATRVGVSRSVELGFALPFVAHQTGSGVEGVTAQNASPLVSSTVRDPRFEIGYGLEAGGERPLWTLRGNLGAVFPLGDSAASAGGSGLTFEPSLGGVLHFGRLTAATLVGLRLRPSVAVADVRYGNQLEARLGLGLRVLEKPGLNLGLEASMLPTLAEQPAFRNADGSAVTNTSFVPAEWLATVAISPMQNLRIVAGFGGGLPLSTQTVVDADGTSHTESYLGLTSPRFRALFGIEVETSP